MSYDGRNNRVQKSDPSGTVNYLVDPFHPSGLAQVLRETDGPGAALADYVYGQDLISMQRGSEVAFYLRDGQWSIRSLADASGAITDSYDYDAFGNTLRRTGTRPNDYLYNSQQRDPNTGLYYLRARNYSPGIGRFLTTDPFQGLAFDPPSLHRYAYAHNDPVNRWDPSGEADAGLMDLGVTFNIQSILQTVALPAAGAATVAAVWASACAIVHNASIVEELYQHGTGQPGRGLTEIEFLWLNKCAQAKYMMEITLEASKGTSTPFHIPVYGFPLGGLTQGVTSVQIKHRLQLLFAVYPPLYRSQASPDELNRQLDQVVARGGISAEQSPANVAAFAEWRWQAWSVWTNTQRPATGRIEVVNKRGHNLSY